MQVKVKDFRSFFANNCRELTMTKRRSDFKCLLGFLCKPEAS